MTEAQNLLVPQEAIKQEPQQTTIESHDHIYNLLCNKDDVSWKQMIYHVVKSEEMNPWDIDLGKLSKRFLVDLKKMKELDFKVSGKIILAAAILLRLKSNKLVGEDLSYLDQLIASSEKNEEDAFYDELTAMDGENTACVNIEGKEYTLMPRTPQPRSRKVSIYDLVEALEKALEVKERRRIFEREGIHMEIPKKEIDIEELVARIFAEVREHFNGHNNLTFSQLLKQGTKYEKVFTFLPLLHLSNAGKVVLAQEQHLGEIHISLGNTVDAPAVHVLAK